MRILHTAMIMLLIRWTRGSTIAKEINSELSDDITPSESKNPVAHYMREILENADAEKISEETDKEEEMDDADTSPSEAVESHVLPNPSAEDAESASPMIKRPAAPRRKRRRRRRKRPKIPPTPVSLEDSEPYYPLSTEDVKTRASGPPSVYRFPESAEEDGEANPNYNYRRRPGKRRRRPNKRPIVDEIVSTAIDEDSQQRTNNNNQDYEQQQEAIQNTDIQKEQPKESIKSRTADENGSYRRPAPVQQFEEKITPPTTTEIPYNSKLPDIQEDLYAKFSIVGSRKRRPPFSIGKNSDNQAQDNIEESTSATPPTTEKGGEKITTITARKWTSPATITTTINPSTENSMYEVKFTSNKINAAVSNPPVVRNFKQNKDGDKSNTPTTTVNEEEDKKDGKKLDYSNKKQPTSTFIKIRRLPPTSAILRSHKQQKSTVNEDIGKSSTDRPAEEISLTDKPRIIDKKPEIDDDNNEAIATTIRPTIQGNIIKDEAKSLSDETTKIISNGSINGEKNGENDEINNQEGNESTGVGFELPIMTYMGRRKSSTTTVESTEIETTTTSVTPPIFVTKTTSTTSTTQMPTTSVKSTPTTVSGSVCDYFAKVKLEDGRVLREHFALSDDEILKFVADSKKAFRSSSGGGTNETSTETTKDEIQLLLKTKIGAARLAKILQSRNLTLDQIIEQQKHSATNSSSNVIISPIAAGSTTNNTIGTQTPLGEDNIPIPVVIDNEKTINGQSTEKPPLEYVPTTPTSGDVGTSSEKIDREPKAFESMAGDKKTPWNTFGNSNVNKQRTKVIFSGNDILSYTSTEAIVPHPTFANTLDAIDQEILLFHDNDEGGYSLRNNVMRRKTVVESTRQKDRDYYGGGSEQQHRRKLPLGVKSAIIITGAILALAVLGFFALLLSCKIRQKRSQMRKQQEALYNHYQNRDVRRSTTRSTTPPVVLKSKYNNDRGYVNNIQSEVSSSNRQYYLWRTLRKTFQYD